jgi:hypothetical protein
MRNPLSLVCDCDQLDVRKVPWSDGQTGLRAASEGSSLDQLPA